MRFGLNVGNQLDSSHLQLKLVSARIAFQEGICMCLHPDAATSARQPPELANYIRIEVEVQHTSVCSTPVAYQLVRLLIFKTWRVLLR